MYTIFYLFTSARWVDGQWLYLLWQVLVFPVCVLGSLVGLAQALPYSELTVFWKSRSQLKHFCVFLIFFHFPCIYLFFFDSSNRLQNWAQVGAAAWPRQLLAVAEAAVCCRPGLAALSLSWPCIWA